MDTSSLCCTSLDDVSPFSLQKKKKPELLAREAVGGFGTCCFRMPLLFRCDFYPSRGRLKPIRQVGRCSIRLPLNHYRRGLSFALLPHCLCRQNAFSRPPSARIREDAKARRRESLHNPLCSLPFWECEKRSAERSESRGEAFGRMLRLSSDRCHPARKNPYRGFCP